MLQKCCFEMEPTVTKPLEIVRVCVNSACGQAWRKKQDEKNKKSNTEHCNRQVSKERASEHSVPHSWPKRLSWARPLGSLGKTRWRKRPGKRRRGGRSPTQCEKRSRRKVGIGPEEKGVGATRRADSPTCRSAFQQRSWPWSR